MDNMTMRTWAEIDFGNLAHNYQLLREMAPEGSHFLGLCKSNGYGHGATQIAGALEKLGADMLAVACLEEAVEMRHDGVTIPILCLGYTDPYFASDVMEYNVTVTVSDFHTAEAFSDAAMRVGKEITVHIKLDTGMTRFGYFCGGDDLDAVADEIARLWTLPNLNIEGLFTHFADADGDEDYTMKQFTRYLQVREKLAERDCTVKLAHSANSAATLRFPATHLDMTRAGIALYGYYPDETIAELDGYRLRPVMTLKSRVWAVRDVPADTAVSYGCTQTLNRDARLAVLPIGYGDGFFRAFSGKASVLLNGQRCPIVGRVCMDVCMIDVTELPDVKVGDVAILYGADGLTEENAKIANTIPYELLCDVNPRVPRIYTGEDALA